MELVHFAHGVVEDAGDNAAVAVAGRSSVALAESEAADEGLAGFVENEFQAHAFGIVHAADEAVVLLYFQVAGVGALSAWHGGILTEAVPERSNGNALRRQGWRKLIGVFRLQKGFAFAKPFLRSR